ncbi:MAG: heme exporter protein CcmB [Deltaproteobacteria bacterium]|nr:heme exporter protein CcmB [Deltaproteobacteria bacterium]
MGKLARDAWAIARKDLRLEVRSKEILLTMGFFGFLAVLVLAFAFRRGDAPIAPVASGSLWVAIAFSGTLGLTRAFDRERDGDCIRALLLAPVAREAIYLGKAVGIVAFMAVVELIVLPAVILFFNLPVDLERLGRTLGVMALGTIGYALVGTLLAASLMRSQARDVLLTVVLYPVIVPVIIGGAMGTQAIFDDRLDLASWALWMRLLMFFDVVFLVASLWIFEALILD